MRRTHQLFRDHSGLSSVIEQPPGIDDRAHIAQWFKSVRFAGGLHGYAASVQVNRNDIARFHYLA
jgi:hypothetical protein